MNTRIVSSIEDNKSRMMSFLIRPIIHGIIGFLFFFGIIILMKYLANVFGVNEVSNAEIEDVMLSMIGFVLNFMIDNYS